MFFGVRHGQRADKADKNEKMLIELNIDPHLSKKGVKQAELTGLYIKKLIENYKNDLILEEKLNKDENIEVLFISSPFLRCLMTSFHIAKNLNVFKNTIFVDKTIAEFLNETDFKKNVLKNLYIEKNDINNYIDLQKENLNLSFEPLFDDPILIKPNFPENLSMAKKRIHSFLNFIEKFFFDNFSEKKYVIIWVSHLFSLEIAVNHYSNTNCYDFGYCSIVQSLINKKTKKCKLLLAGTNEQINGL